MEKKNKKPIMIILAVLLILAGSGFVMFVGACGFESGPSARFHKRGFPPRFVHKEIGEFMLWKIDKGARDLGLNEIQQSNYEKFRFEIEEFITQGSKKKSELKMQIISEFQKENPDMTVMTNRIKADIENVSGSVVGIFDLFNTFYTSLDEDQKKVITSKIKEKMDQCPRM